MSAACRLLALFLVFRSNAVQLDLDRSVNERIDLYLWESAAGAVDLYSHSIRAARTLRVAEIDIDPCGDSKILVSSEL